MSEFNDLVGILSPSDYTKFINYLGQKRSTKTKDNIHLFEALSKGDALLWKQKLGSNTFHVAKKRLKDNMMEFIAQQSFETEAKQEHLIIKQLLIAKKLFANNKNQLAFKVLMQAKRKAQELNFFALLNEIFQNLLENSHLRESPDPTILIEEFQYNLEQHALSAQRNMANAKLRKAFVKADSDGQDLDIFQELASYKQLIGKSSNHYFDFKDLLQIAKIADSEGSYTKNYAEVNLFFIERLKEIQESDIDRQQQLPYHIEILLLIANIYFRKKEFDQSIAFLSQMKTQLLRFESKLYKKYQLSYWNLLALNYNFIGKYQKAEIILDQIILESKYPNESILNHLLVRVMIHFQQNELKKAVQLFTRFQESDKWYETRMGKDWMLNKLYIEILLHIELENLDYVDSKIQSLTRKYNEYFTRKESFQISPFLKLVKEVYKYPNRAVSESFISKVEKRINRKPAEQEDLFLMCFYAWLKSKMTQQSLYATTLKLLNG
ncbi:MAG: hypothetical protein JKY48_17080 [Flavobacteriales bacterium]|nr:hypothetical protein [Flavobacteriales bacterium]